MFLDKAAQHSNSSIQGDVVHLSVFGHSIVLLNTPEAINDLLESRFRIYSDRPELPLMDLYVLCVPAKQR